MKGLKCLLKHNKFPTLSLSCSLSSVSIKGRLPTRIEQESLSTTQQKELLRNDLFSKELSKQKKNIGRIEKIEVQYRGTPEDVNLIMNKQISTPFDCAKHMSEMLTKRSALARVNGQVWDMHRPLEEDCELELLHMKESDPYHCNKAFWRSCSMMLGAVAQQAFRDNFRVDLHSFPSPNVRSGSFVYDVDIDLPDWNPSQDELRILSAHFVNLARKELRFERLVVDAALAEQMFVDNPHKAEQIPLIASQLADDNKIVLYRLGTHVDISRGPLIANTGFVGRCTIASVHKVETEKGQLYRFQGVALPNGILLNHFAYGILEDRARKLNPAWIPGGQLQSSAKQ